MSSRALSLAFAATLLACSAGRSVNPPGGGGGSSGGGSSGGGSSGGGSGSGGGLGSSCPTSEPSNGSSCNDMGLACEYAYDQDLLCSAYFVCEAGGTWTAHAPTGTSCPTHGPGVSGCAADYASVPLGNACTPSGLECAYPQGRCACTTQISGPPMVGGSSPKWVCEQPGAGCPEPRPSLGSQCATDGQFCDYGSCTLPNGSALTCENGSWAVSPAACAD